MNSNGSNGSDMTRRSSSSSVYMSLGATEPSPNTPVNSASVDADESIMDQADAEAGDAIRAAAIAPITVKSFIQTRAPVMEWLPQYKLWRDLPGDLVAGITIGLMVIPQGLSYAAVAGVPPIYGLYSAFMGLFIYSCFGGCKDISVGPTAILSLLSYQANGGDVEVAIQMTLLSGIFQILLATFKLGNVVDFISAPVLSGFTSAASIQIILTQVSHVCGYKTRDEVYFAVYDFFDGLHKLRYPDLLLGLGSAVVLYFLSTLKKRFPHSALAHQLCIGRNALIVLFTGLVSYLISLSSTTPWKLVGSIPSGLPTPEFPGMSTDTIKKQAGNVALSAVVGFLESIAIAKAFARRNGYAHKLHSNQELFAIGLANTVGSFFRALPVTGSFSRTAVASQAGAKTQLQGVVTGSIVLLALVLLTPAFKFIPNTVLSAVVIVAAGALIDVGICRELWRKGRLGRMDLFSLIVSFLGCLLLDIQYGMLAAVAVSLVIMLWQMARPTHMVDPGVDGTADEESASLVRGGKFVLPSSVLLLRLHCSMVFFNIDYLCTLISRIEAETFRLVPGTHPSIIETEAGSHSSPDPLKQQRQRNSLNDLSDDSVISSALLAPSSDSTFDPVQSEAGGPSTILTARFINGEHKYANGQEVAASSSVPLMQSYPSASSGAFAALLRPCRMSVLLLDFSSVNVIDTSAVKGLFQVAQDYSTRRKPVQVHFVHVLSHVKKLLLDSADSKTFPYGIEQHIHQNVEDAIRARRLQVRPTQDSPSAP